MNTLDLNTMAVMNQTVKIDSRGRINLSAYAPGVDTFLLSMNAEGTIVLVPAIVMPIHTYNELAALAKDDDPAQPGVEPGRNALLIHRGLDGGDPLEGDAVADA